MTPIFDQLVRELGFVENSELPAVRYEPEPTFGYTIDHLMALKAALVRYQERHRLPVPPDAPYYVNRDNHSLQKVTIQPSSDMVERCLPSKETCMTLDEIPGGQQHGVVIPPDPSEQDRLYALMERNPDWVLRDPWQTREVAEFQNNDLRGFVARFDADGKLENVQYFDQGQPTMVQKAYPGQAFDSLVAAVVDRNLWLGHLERLSRDARDDGDLDHPEHFGEVDLDAEMAEAQRLADNEETRRLDELAAEEAERLIAEKRVGHDYSDGKYLNPGAVIANRHHTNEETEVVESGGATFRRNPSTGAISMSTGTLNLPPDIAEKVQAKVKALGETMQKLGVPVLSQPSSVHATGPEHEILREAATTISSGRQDDYGHAEDSFATIAGMWESYLSARFGEPVEIDGRDVAMMMSLLKVARDAASRKRDNLVDLAGYAALAERTIGSDR